MRDVVVILPRSFGLRELAQTLATSPFEVVGPSEGRIAVKLNDEVVQFVYDQTLLEHYEESEELSLIASLGNEPNLFLVNFKSTLSLGQVLACTVDRPDALVDNDFGRIEPGSDFVRHFRERPDWDWIP